MALTFKSVFKKLGKVGKVVAPLAAGALGIPAVAAGVSGIAIKAAGALGKMQRSGNAAATTPAAVAGDAASAYFTALNETSDTNARTGTGRFAQTLAAIAGDSGKLKVYAGVAAAAFGGWFFFLRRPSAPVRSSYYGRR